jgi:hypothetical protein
MSTGLAAEEAGSISVLSTSMNTQNASRGGSSICGLENIGSFCTTVAEWQLLTFV